MQGQKPLTRPRGDTKRKKASLAHKSLDFPPARRHRGPGNRDLFQDCAPHKPSGPSARTEAHNAKSSAPNRPLRCYREPHLLPERTMLPSSGILVGPDPDFCHGSSRPRLRGGSRKGGPLGDDERVPAALWWLAGGVGTPSTGAELRDWKRRDAESKRAAGFGDGAWSTFRWVLWGHRGK